MRLLDGALRSYAWGSRTALAELCGRPSPSAHPEAELWFGAHPADPAWVSCGERRTSLLDLIADDPEGQLGPSVVPRFGKRLPFLIKLLAAEEPLSLQAHPSAAQAREGFERENRARVPMDAPVRNYKDESAKPEVVVALEPFDALAGFRDPHTTVALLRGLDVRALDTYVALLDGQPDASGLRALFTTWITLPPPALASLLDDVLDGCVRYLSGGDSRFTAEVQTALELAAAYPNDAGVLASLLLNRVHLRPGESIHLAAGNLHAYLHGVAVEVMANSDNVLRGGLTPKHVDVPELLRVLDFEPTPMTACRSVPAAQGCGGRYLADVDEFALTCLELDDAQPVRIPADGLPAIMVCTSGAVELAWAADAPTDPGRAGAGAVCLDRGSAAWISASDPDIVVTAQVAPAQIFHVTVG
ncbi:mannose-6-phosphate isomerase, class I [Aldersonia sp. NBC_00410]|uniref:mannose-6-phosphate isomerase, class I n=1 Tax=Aldersonia sp. NBC_00410 TaxID=2975954 RepID=UPI00225778C7|nr:mannose-6-phosphate isomerase, class I [Aldersonia sp. NBC_00410]MCX5044537.1 mannose-6-phosphate isomerase, class I [Aldersonia sp. NBC_00410]